MVMQISIFAQPVAVKGKVVDSQGNGIAGINILEKGTTKGVFSDANGEYSITVDKNAVLVFSFLGYNKEEVPVAGKTTININMTESIKSLDEIIVIGYGTQRKSDLTGAVASVKIEDLKGRSVINVEQMLQGTVAGVSAVSASGLNVSVKWIFNLYFRFFYFIYSLLCFFCINYLYKNCFSI